MTILQGGGRMTEVNLFNYIMTMLQFGIMYAAFDYMMTRRCKLAFIIIADVAAINVSFFVLVLFFEKYTLLRSLVGLAIFLLPLLLYSDKWYKKLAIFLSAMVIMSISEYLVVSIDSRSVVWAGVSNLPLYAKLPRYCAYILGYTVMMAILCMAVKHLDTRYAYYLRPFEFMTMSAFLISQYILTVGWAVAISDMSEQQTTFLLIAVAFGVLSDVGLFITMIRISQRSKLGAENALLRQQIDAQKEYYGTIARQSDSIRRMRHDIANHLITINALLDDGQNEQARQYTHELQQTGVYQSMLGKCLNISADAFLSARFCRLRDSGITLDLDIELPAKTGIPDADLISAIGNLLDNAEEACRSTADRRISMSAKLSGEYLVITTENPYAGEHPQQRKRRIPELERGVGFHILRELAEKYDGEFTSQPDGGIFRTSLILKTGAASNV